MVRAFAGEPEKREKLEMRGTKRRFRHWILGALVASAALCMVFVPAFAQTLPTTGGKVPGPIVGGFDQLRELPPGGPAPRTADGHPDLTGRWYPNGAGRMLQGAYPVDPVVFRQFDPKVMPEEAPSFKPGLPAKYTRRYAYGICDQAGTPSTTLEQISQHAPMELIQTPGRLAMLYEYPLDVRMIYTNGRSHPKDPDPTFNGDSAAHWEGDTLVIDVIAIDERFRNITGAGGSGWFPSDQEHVVERFSRPSKNYLIYQVTIEDPVVLAKPWKSAPRRWSLAQGPNDEWGEVFCTLNQEPEEYQKITEQQAKPKGK
ncbi:MAG: hypothetical protein DMG31_10865 [Acidobacteria bacterium]|nr:MAG: hypothetical protein DMG31_10865 [Acidobacteriota bacterium]